MNERIRELANIWANRRSEDEKLGITYTFSEKALETFAELIVRECLGCSNNLANHYIDNHSEKEQTLLLASIADYSNEIRKHFGVEVTELDEPETPFWRPVMTNTVADLRSVVNNAMNRGEHNIAIALIELIKKNS